VAGAAVLLVLALVLWLIARSGHGPRREDGPGTAEEGGNVTVDDLWLHDEANPDDDGDVGDSSGSD
jgi:hypothetical protein